MTQDHRNAPDKPGFLARLQARAGFSEDQIMLTAMLAVFAVIGLILVASIIAGAGIEGAG